MLLTKISALLIMGLLFSLSGCGKTGPLYLPDETVEVNKNN